MGSVACEGARGEGAAVPIIHLDENRASGKADSLDGRAGVLSLFTRTADAELRERGLFIGESLKVIERAQAAGVKPRAMLLPEKLLEMTMPAIERALAADAAVPVYVVPKTVFKKITGYEVVRSALCVFERPAVPSVADILGAGARRVAVLEDIGNSTNVGAIFRSAAALGIDAVLVTPSCHDPLFRRAARVSMGTVFQVPWTRIGSVQAWAGEGVRQLHDLGFKVAAMALSDDSVPMDDMRLRAEGKLAIVMGTEGEGLAAATIDAADYTVKIPMAHDVDSLNVAAASAVAFWELRVR